MAEEFNPTQALTPQAQQPPTPIRQIEKNVYTTGFDDETVRRFDFDLYKGRLNETDRIHILNPRGLIKARSHYHDKLKYVRCNSEFQQTGQQELLQREAGCCKMLGKSDQRFAALILRYVTDRAGALIRPFHPPEFRLWKFSVDKFLALRDINANFPLQTVDLSITCTEVQYQKMTITAIPPANCIYTRPDFPAGLRQQIEQWLAASLPKLPGEMGHTMTDQEIAKELGQAMAVAPQMTPADVPLAGVFDDLVSASTTPQK